MFRRSGSWSGEAASMSICNLTMLMAVAAASSPLLPAAAAVQRLLHVVHGQHAERDRHVPLDLQLRDALRHALTDEVEVPRIALNDASERDHGVHVGIFREKLRTERQLERTGDILDLNVHVGASGGAQRAHGTFQQRLRHLPVPLGHDDSEPHVRSRRQRRIEFGKVMVSGRHLAALLI